MERQYQLVFQFEASGREIFEDLLSLTEEITEALSEDSDVVVDGHDYGLSEFNIFIHTNRPGEVFELIASLIDSKRPGIPFSSGYRAFTEERYIPLWPRNALSFVVG